MPRPIWRFYARGRTYHQRDTLCSWGWYWSHEDRAWCYDGSPTGDESDACIRAMTRLPGVRVTKRDVRREPMR